MLKYKYFDHGAKNRRMEGENGRPNEYTLKQAYFVHTAEGRIFGFFFKS